MTQHHAIAHNSRFATYPEMLADLLANLQAAQSGQDIIRCRTELVNFVIRAFDHLTPNRHNRSYMIHLQLAADVLAQEWSKIKDNYGVLRAACFVLENDASKTLKDQILPPIIDMIRDMADTDEQFQAIDMVMQTNPPEQHALALSQLWDNVVETVPGTHHRNAADRAQAFDRPQIFKTTINTTAEPTVLTPTIRPT